MSRQARRKARRNSTTAPLRRSGAKTSGSCRTGKSRFPNKVEAMIALADTTRPTAKHGRFEQRIYLCPMCAGWHMTSQSLRTSAGLRRGDDAGADTTVRNGDEGTSGT